MTNFSPCSWMSAPRRYQSRSACSSLLQWISTFHFYGGVMKPRLLIQSDTDLGLFVRCVCVSTVGNCVPPFALFTHRGRVCVIGVWACGSDEVEQLLKHFAFLISWNQSKQSKEDNNLSDWKLFWETHSWIFVFKFETSNLIFGHEKMKNQEGVALRPLSGSRAFSLRVLQKCLAASAFPPEMWTKSVFVLLNGP